MIAPCKLSPKTWGHTFINHPSTGQDRVVSRTILAVFRFRKLAAFSLVPSPRPAVWSSRAATSTSVMTATPTVSTIWPTRVASSRRQPTCRWRRLRFPSTISWGGSTRSCSGQRTEAQHISSRLRSSPSSSSSSRISSFNKISSFSRISSYRRISFLSRNSTIRTNYSSSWCNGQPAYPCRHSEICWWVSSSVHTSCHLSRLKYISWVVRALCGYVICMVMPYTCAGYQHSAHSFSGDVSRHIGGLATATFARRFT